MDDKKLIKLAEFADKPELTQFQEILDLKEDLEELEGKLEESTNKICEDIYDIPQYSDKLDAILDKLNEPEEEDEITVTLNII